jgi:hypothetical protein
MSRRPIRCFEYVNAPYGRVAELVGRDPLALFRAATAAASTRAESVAVGLRVDVGGVEIGTEVAITLEGVQEEEPHGPSSRVTRVSLRWQAASHAAWFPTMTATLSLYPLSASETQVDLDGHYEPPGGLLGAGADALVGHRIAEASVHRLVREIAHRLRSELAGPDAAASPA